MIRWFFLMTCFLCAFAMSSARETLGQQDSDPDQQQAESSDGNQATSDPDEPVSDDASDESRDEDRAVPDSRDTETPDSETPDIPRPDSVDNRADEDQDRGRQDRAVDRDDADARSGREVNEDLPEASRVRRSNQIDLGVDVTSENGSLRISGVNEGTIAAQIGLRQNDQVVSVDGRRVTSADEWNQALTRGRSDQQRIPIIVNRNGNQTTIYIEPRTLRGAISQSRRQQRLDMGVVLVPGAGSGLIVRDVTGGIAEVIGLQPNDVVLSVGGRSVRSANQFERWFTDGEFVGTERVPLIVSRGGRRVTLYYQPSEWNLADRGRDRYVESADTWLGVSLDTRYRDAAVVREVVPDSPADHAGVRAGDQIVRMNGRLVRSPAHLTALVDSRRPGEEIEMEVARRVSRTLYATLEEKEEPRRQVLRPSFDRRFQVEPRRFRTAEPAEVLDPDFDRRGVRDRLGPQERGILDRLDADEIPDEPRLQR